MKTALISIFFCFSIVGFSQSTTRNVWAAANISYRVSDFTFGLEEGIRFTETNINQTYSDIGIKYKINKYLRTGITWRNAQKNGLLDANRIDNRFSGDVIGRYKKKGFLLFIRMRYQSKYKDWFVSKYGRLPESYIRTKLGFRYSLMKKISLETAAETYYAFKPGENYINRYRLSLGLNYQIKKQHAIELNYIYQSEVQEAKPESGHILSIAYSYDLNAALKKSRKRKKKQAKKEASKV